MKFFLSSMISFSLPTPPNQARGSSSRNQLVRQIGENLTETFGINFPKDDKETERKSRATRSVVDEIADSDLVLAMKKKIKEIMGEVGKLIDQLNTFYRQNNSSSSESEIPNIQVKSRRKRNLLTSGFSSLRESLGQAKGNFGNILKQPLQNVPFLSNQMGSSGNSISGISDKIPISIPGISGNSSAIPNILQISDIVNNFIAAGKDFYSQFVNSVIEIAEAIKQSLNTASESSMIPPNLSDMEKVNEIIAKDMEKVNNVYKLVDETLKQIGEKTDFIAGKLHSSQCVAEFSNIPGLLSAGRQCLKNKLDDGLKIANDTFTNLSDTFEIPGDIVRELNQCGKNDENIMAKILCFLKVPLQLEEQKYLLPIAYVKRILEINQYFATMKSDLIRCGITTIVSIGTKIENCAGEMISITKEIASMIKIPQDIV